MWFFFSTNLVYRKTESSNEDWQNNSTVFLLWFESYRFLYQTEFAICDWTCLIGEVGGNLGFFLGGSILAYFNVLVDTVQGKSK